MLKLNWSGKAGNREYRLSPLNNESQSNCCKILHDSTPIKSKGQYEQLFVLDLSPTDIYHTFRYILVYKVGCVCAELQSEYGLLEEDIERLSRARFMTQLLKVRLFPNF